MEKILDNLYQVQIPMPKNPLKYLNSYFIRGEKFNLIIDTGLNHKKSEEILMKAIVDMDFSPVNTKLFITHLHADHCGLGVKLNKMGMEVIVSDSDGKIINSPGDWEKMLEFAKKLGMPLDRLEEARDQHPGYRFRPIGKINYTPIKDGDNLDLGNFKFTIIHTPGHTMGHLCLYEKEKKIFISGDHILDEITPNISQWRENTTPLKDYLKSLDKIKDLPVSLVLPGHRRVVYDLKNRVHELQKHHEKRLNEVLDILKKHPGLTAYEIASYMTWDMSYKTWDEFPMGQKWFATGEAQAHLDYLCDKGLVYYEDNDKFKYFLKRS